MASYLFGSSNVYRSFSRAVEAGRFSGLDLQLIRCTKKTVFDSHIETLSSNSKLVVTSILANFIVDVCTGIPDDEVQLFAHQQVTAHVETLLGLVSRDPLVNVIIVPPLYRSTPAWFGPYLPDILGFLAAEVGRIGAGRISICAPVVVVPSIIEEDGIHLNPAGGDRFLAHIDASLQLLIARLNDPTDEMEVESVSGLPGPSFVDLQTSPLNARVDHLSKTVSGLEMFVRRRFKDDDLIFARMKEESDAVVNRNREDRVVITGLAGLSVQPSTHAEKKAHYSASVSRLIEIAFASSENAPQVQDVYVNMRKDRGQPLVEIRLNSASGASSFRCEGVRLAKAKHPEFAELFFANSVTQATRVRIEVLKALSKKLTSTTEEAFVQGFISRPVLQYHVREGERSQAEGVGRSYCYVDAIAKFGTLLNSSDLTKAYLRAGTTFAGALSQYFVVLTENRCEPHSLRSGSNRVPIGRRGGRASGRGRLQPASARNLFAMTIDGDRERGVKRPPGETDVPTPSKRKENELITE